MWISIKCYSFIFFLKEKKTLLVVLDSPYTYQQSTYKIRSCMIFFSQYFLTRCLLFKHISSSHFAATKLTLPTSICKLKKKKRWLVDTRLKYMFTLEATPSVSQRTFIHFLWVSDQGNSASGDHQALKKHVQIELFMITTQHKV